MPRPPRQQATPASPQPEPKDAPAAPPDDLLGIVRLLPDVVFRCRKRADGRIEWTFNEGRLAQEFHLTTADIKGKTLEDMFPPPVVEQIRPHFEAAFRGEVREFTNELFGRHFRHVPQPVFGPDGRVVEVVGFIAEVTSLVLAERRIVELNRDLQAFTTSLTHDLQNPLSVLRTDTMLLRSRFGPDLGPEGARTVDRMERATARMQQLIEDTLRFSRSALGELRRVDVDVAAVARDVADQLEAAEPSRQVTWSLPARLKVWADAGLLRTALENLLSNAWKYTRDSAPARIALSGQSTPDGVELRVADNGIGFDAQEAGRLFEPFHRLAGAQGYPGTGIGLATVRRIAERHGGRAWAEATPGQGAVFHLLLPRAAP